MKNISCYVKGMTWPSEVEIVLTKHALDRAIERLKWEGSYAVIAQKLKDLLRTKGTYFAINSIYLGQQGPSREWRAPLKGSQGVEVVFVFEGETIVTIGRTDMPKKKRPAPDPVARNTRGTAEARRKSPQRRQARENR